MRQNEAISVAVPAKVYLDLIMHLRKSGDLRGADEVVAFALRQWMAGQRPGGRAPGYQWQSLFLPEGTELRVRLDTVWHYARIAHDRIDDQGTPHASPRAWLLDLTGSVRNAWRDIWIRRDIRELWSQAAHLRATHPRRPGGAERRCRHRRCTD